MVISEAPINPSRVSPMQEYYLQIINDIRKTIAENEQKPTPKTEEESEDDGFVIVSQETEENATPWSIDHPKKDFFASFTQNKEKKECDLRLAIFPSIFSFHFFLVFIQFFFKPNKRFASCSMPTCS